MNTPFPTDDRILLGALRQNDKKAFDTLFRKYYPLLCAYAHRFVELEDAEEIVQDVMLWLWEKRAVEVIPEALGAYLLKAVYRRALNQVVRTEIKHRADTFFYQRMEEKQEVAEPLLLAELGSQIKAAIGRLPPTYREAFLRHRLKGQSYKEIATALDISPKTVDYRIQQALRLLRRELKDYLPFIELYLAGSFPFLFK